VLRQNICFIPRQHYEPSLQAVPSAETAKAEIPGMPGVRYVAFGDTVNTVSRMETCSKPMSINVSEATYARTRDTFSFLQGRLSR
jgi:hypothetical protein